jgi:hypothetical protein
MTSLKLFYQRGAPAALVLGLIVGAPDIAQAVQLRGGFYPSIPARSTSLVPFGARSSSLTTRSVPIPPPKTPAPAFAPSYKPGAAARGGRGGGGIDLTHAGDAGDISGGDGVR